MTITIPNDHKYKIGDSPSGNKSWRIIEIFTEQDKTKAKCERVPDWKSKRGRSSHNFR